MNLTRPFGARSHRCYSRLRLKPLVAQLQVDWNAVFKEEASKAFIARGRRRKIAATTNILSTVNDARSGLLGSFIDAGDGGSGGRVRRSTPGAAIRCLTLKRNVCFHGDSASLRTVS